jgi:hypothetical protein
VILIDLYSEKPDFDHFSPEKSDIIERYYDVFKDYSYFNTIHITSNMNLAS